MKRTIWIYWAQGFNKAPYLVQKCLESWKRHNCGSWDIMVLSDDNIGEYLTDDSITRLSADKQITKPSISDIVRIKLLRAHAGLWVDATTYCRKPLDSWLNDYVQTGFFAFKHSNDRIMANWFMYADECNYIAEKMHEAVIAYVNANAVLGCDVPHVSIDEWRKGVSHDHYFWFHYLFWDLYVKDSLFKESWDNVKQIDARPTHQVRRKELMNAVTKEIKEEIDMCESPVFKLSHRCGHIDEGSVLAYLLGNR